MLQTIVKETQFVEIPQILIDDEKQKMFAELKQNLEHQGLSFEDYLKNLKKTEEDLAKDFAKGATERAKTALILRQIAKEEKISLVLNKLTEAVLYTDDQLDITFKVLDRIKRGKK